MPPITRSEQVELDELLSDIYRCIETLPDQNKSRQVIGRAYVREFEVPETSPLVQEHKKAIAASRQQQKLQQQQPQQRQLQPQRSTLRRQQTGGNDYTSNLRNEQQTSGANQSLASFLNANPASSATPDNKRRVRIVDHKALNYSDYNNNNNNDQDDEDYADDDYPNDYYSLESSQSHRNGGNKSEKVKQVNTNKLIYHDEYAHNNTSNLENGNKSVSREYEDDDDIDGVTRVEYYHTTWLDRHLGKASRRRSSKELNERQVKEKAMIEELKRSLKNGAITLRQSFKGKRNSGNNKQHSDIFDDELLDFDKNKREQSKVVKTGIATLPRHQHNNKINKNSTTISQTPATNSLKFNSFWSTGAPKKRYLGRSDNWRSIEEPIDLNSYIDQYTNSVGDAEVSGTGARNKQPGSCVQPKQTSDQNDRQTTINSTPSQATSAQSRQQSSPMQHSTLPSNNQVSDSYSSRTLPHKTTSTSPHQLLQAHYRGNLSSPGQSRTLNRTFTSGSPRADPIASATTSTISTSYPNKSNYNHITSNKSPAEKMHNTAYSVRNSATHCESPSQQQSSGMKSPLQQQNVFGASISSVPSASEVVRTALSRSNSQLNVNQLNKTINSLPQSPMTPTHQLKPTSPSLSLSPSPTPKHQQYSSKTLGHQPHQQMQQQREYLPGQTVLHGTRTVGRPPQAQQPIEATHTPSIQSTSSLGFTSPHASLMQHRMEQQSKQPNRNTASIREFNELDSLLRSLSPGVMRTSAPLAGQQTSRPPYSGASSSATTQITPGLSSRPAQASLGGYLPTNYQQQQRSGGADIYAKVHKQGSSQQSSQAVGHQSAQDHQQPFTIDVTDKRLDENCIQRQRQEISEFEPPIDLLPSMEDYQNITKLNPVKNYYWYKPNMSREEAIRLLKDKPQGTFIVRDSNSFKGAYGLAVKVSKLPKNVLASLMHSNGGDQSAEYIRHFLIEPTGAGVRLKGYANEPVFDSLPDLIYQHSLTELALPCRLVIPRADIEDSRFNQKQKQFFDEFVASKEQAKHQPYERTSPDGGFRRYPGNVLVHNEHRIIFE